MEIIEKLIIHIWTKITIFIVSSYFPYLPTFLNAFNRSNVAKPSRGL